VHTDGCPCPRDEGVWGEQRYSSWAGRVAHSERRGAYRVSGGNLTEGDHLEDSGIGGRIILKWASKKWEGHMDWIDLARDMDRWRFFVNAVMNLWVPSIAENILTS
jgi:hypothetical protein